MEERLEKYNTKEFKEWIKDIFISIQNAWNENDLEKLIYLESSLLFERDAEMIRANIAANRREVRTSIVVSNIYIREYKKVENRETLKVELKASMENFVYDNFTREILSGIADYKKTNKYLMTLGKMGDKENQTKIKCRSCGAVMNIAASGRCEYCGSIGYSDLYDWIVEEIEVYEEDEEVFH